MVLPTGVHTTSDSKQALSVRCEDIAITSSSSGKTASIIPIRLSEVPATVFSVRNSSVKVPKALEVTAGSCISTDGHTERKDSVSGAV